MDKLPDAESDAYFHSRPRGSQIGAIVSPQSTVLHQGRLEIEQRNREVQEVCALQPVLRGKLEAFHYLHFFVQIAHVQLLQPRCQVELPAVWSCWLCDLSLSRLVSHAEAVLKCQSISSGLALDHLALPAALPQNAAVCPVPCH